MLTIFEWMALQDRKIGHEIKVLQYIGISNKNNGVDLLYVSMATKKIELMEHS